MWIEAMTRSYAGSQACRTAAVAELAAADESRSASGPAVFTNTGAPMQDICPARTPAPPQNHHRRHLPLNLI